MKYSVLALVGIWFAFVTVAQSFHAVDALLILNHFSVASILIVGFCSLMIGFGYTMFFISMLEHRIPRMKAITIIIATFVAVLLMFVGLQTIKRSGNPLMLNSYVHVDMYLRENFDTTISGMDYGNSLLLLASCLWWLISGVILLALHQRRKKKV